MVKHQQAVTPQQPKSGFSAQLKVFLVQLLQQRPLIFWSGVWAIALMLISGSIATLLDPTVSRQVSLPEMFPSSQPIATPSPILSAPVAPAEPQLQASPVPKPPSQAIEQGQPMVPYRALAAIVLGCGLGSVLISRMMDRSQKPPRVLRSVAPTPPRQHPLPRRAEIPSAHLPQPVVPSTSYQMPPALTTRRAAANLKKTEARPATATATATATAAAPPIVTVLPPETNHSLDWDESSLVNALDLRKQRSLSSWL